MRVLAHDPFVADGDPAWRDVARAEFETVLAGADVVSLHVPLTANTRHLIDAAQVARMKPGAVLINTARGGTVDENAVIDALRSGHLAGAAFDVFETEPVIAGSGDRFAGVGNLVLTPHIAGVTQESNVRVSALTAENVRKVLRGR
jgi:(S)-sulfolactate dehydrogenase